MSFEQAVNSSPIFAVHGSQPRASRTLSARAARYNIGFFIKEKSN